MRRIQLTSVSNAGGHLKQSIQNVGDINASRVPVAFSSLPWLRPTVFWYQSQQHNMMLMIEQPYFESISGYWHHQQMRSYVPQQRIAVYPECWYCRQTNVSSAESMMICIDCGHIRDVNVDINYFHLMGMTWTFNVSSQSLIRRYHYLQTLVHPDKFVNKSLREQANSSNWSSLINTAYRTLLTPMERGQYILKLHGYYIPDDNNLLNREFLSQMMARNEEVERAKSRTELLELNEKLNNDIQVKISRLKSSLSELQFEDAREYLIEMRYMFNIEKNIKIKLESI